MDLIAHELAEWDSVSFPSKEAWAGLAEADMVLRPELEIYRYHHDLEYYAQILIVGKARAREGLQIAWGHVLKTNTPCEMWKEIMEVAQGNRLNPPVHWSSRLNWSQAARDRWMAAQLPSYHFGLESLLENSSRIGILRGLAAALCYKADTGKLPEDWKDLVPKYLEQVPNDPFVDEPMKLKTNDARLVIYSVGSDGQDKGGECKDFASPNGENIGIMFPPSPKQPSKAGGS